MNKSLKEIKDAKIILGIDVPEALLEFTPKERKAMLITMELMEEDKKKKKVGWLRRLIGKLL